MSTKGTAATSVDQGTTVTTGTTNYIASVSTTEATMVAGLEFSVIKVKKVGNYYQGCTYGSGKIKLKYCIKYPTTARDGESGTLTVTLVTEGPGGDPQILETFTLDGDPDGKATGT